MSPSLLGTRLDGEVILLDLKSARLFHLDAWSLRVWEACDGRDATALAAALDTALDRVSETLLSLADAGVIHTEGPGWVQSTVGWV
ncbi:MAG TPA: PqqD family peptide modification chaperone [bacterium]|nr:PqqD family peptide modification chaperone [bacterium]